MAKIYLNAIKNLENFCKLPRLSDMKGFNLTKCMKAVECQVLQDYLHMVENFNQLKE